MAKKKKNKTTQTALRKIKKQDLTILLKKLTKQAWHFPAGK